MYMHSQLAVNLMAGRENETDKKTETGTETATGIALALALVTRTEKGTQ